MKSPASLWACWRPCAFPHLFFFSAFADVAGKKDSVEPYIHAAGESFTIQRNGTVTDACAQVNDPELREEHYAYVLDIADRLGLPPHVVTPVFRDTLRTLAADATIETFVVLLAAKKTMAKLRDIAGTTSSFHDE